MIAQIDKQNAAMIADPVTPPRETRIRSNVSLANFPACVRPVPVRHLILKISNSVAPEKRTRQQALSSDKPQLWPSCRASKTAL